MGIQLLQPPLLSILVDPVALRGLIFLAICPPMY